MNSVPQDDASCQENNVGLTDYEKSVARRRIVETWPLAADLQREFVEAVRPFVKTHDLLLLEQWVTWRWSCDPKWNTNKVVEVDVLERADTERLTELFDEFETLWREDLGLDGFVMGETHSLEPSKKKEPTKPEWQWRTLADAYKEKPPREYVVKGLLPLPSLNVLFGNQFQTLLRNFSRKRMD